MDWPRIRPRDGTDLWSDASNLSGDKVGKDYEQLVRGKLLGESGQQDDRDIEVSAYLQEQECRLLMNLWREAFRASQESWETNHEPQYRFNRPITTKTDVRLTRRINIPERLKKKGYRSRGSVRQPKTSGADHRGNQRERSAFSWRSF